MSGVNGNVIMSGVIVHEKFFRDVVLSPWVEISRLPFVRYRPMVCAFCGDIDAGELEHQLVN